MQTVSRRSVIGSATATFALASLVISSAHAQVVAIPGLRNTGVNAAGTALIALGGTEVNYSIVAGPNGFTPTAFVLSNPAGSYFATTDSRWIWQNANGSGGTGTPYVFRLTFDLTGLNAATATVNGLYGTDNLGVVSLNGGANSFASSTFSSLTSFSFTSGFVAGINTLDFKVTDVGNPGAFNVSSISGTAQRQVGNAPEAGSMALAFVGIVPLAVVAVRRRNTSH